MDMRQATNIGLNHQGQATEEATFSWSSKIRRPFENTSLVKRMFISSTLVLCAFLVSAALMLNTVFTISLESIVQEKLTLHIYQLLAVGESDNDQIQLPTRVAEPRLNQQQGSLLAFVTELAPETQQQEVWRSLSATGKTFSFPAPNSGDWFFGRAQGAGGAEYYVSSYNTTWSNNSGGKTKYIFTVMEDFSYYQSQLTKYRAAIIIGLLLFGLIFLLLQTIILRVGLSPVRRITADIEAMNNGKARSLSGQYPKELKPLTTNLNILIGNERHQRERYRNRMADLSHSLKTPLSVLRGIETDIDNLGQPVSRKSMMDTLTKQVGRMTNIVDHQLQRAILNGAPTVFSTINIADSANELVAALNKVYANKAIECELNIGPALSFYGDENDLIEIIGNLLDNAYKHAKQSVCFSVTKTNIKPTGPQLHLTFADDGHGVPLAKRATIIKRGVRLDSSGEGQGFGLSIVADIVNNYQGKLTIEDSSLGGASFNITIPTR